MPVRVIRDSDSTRQENIRTLATLPVEVGIHPSEQPQPVYQHIAEEAARMHADGVFMSRIASHFGVDHHTAAKAVRWFRRR